MVPRSTADDEPREAANHDVLTGLSGQVGTELLDRLAVVLVGVDVLLTQQDDVVQPFVELPRDDLLADVLGPIRGLLRGDPLLPLAVLGRDLVLTDRDRRRRR